MTKATETWIALPTAIEYQNAENGVDEQWAHSMLGVLKPVIPAKAGIHLDPGFRRGDEVWNDVL